MGSPPHPQTDSDRDFLKSLSPLLNLKGFPEDFEFPLVADPNYVPPVNTFYCLITGVVLCVITSLVVCLRLWIRSRGLFGMDDWAMLASYISYCILGVINLTAVFGSGLGFHLYDLSAKDIHTFLVQIYLKVVLGLSYGFLAFCIACEIAECGPPNKGFLLSSQFDGTCIGSRSMWLYGLLIAGHIGLDALTIFPPLFVLARLPLAPGKKFNLIFLLVLGVFTMVFSGVRLYIFYRIMLDSYDLTWNATAVAFWGMLESSLAAIIACLPALNQLIIKYIRRIYYHSNDSPAPEIATTGLGISIFERNFVFQGNRKVVSSSVDATAARGAPENLELGEVGRRIERTAAPTSRGRIMQRTANDSYLDIDVAVEGGFYLAGDPESGHEPAGHFINPIMTPRAVRRPSSPTISGYATRQATLRK
ncbi:hypothetical protein TWF481_003044 [Arthrobotrys musiformis]|uniref:Rhodopsin domain-containing protein n=1 Tax=Arthrobotrys musiformis TaxID=47236 RepID=A0AAV9VP38_9PEZI